MPVIYLHNMPVLYFLYFIAENTGAQGAFLKVKKRRLKFCSVRFETLLVAIKHAMRELKVTRI